MTLNASHDHLFKNYVYNEKAKHLFDLQCWVKWFNGDDAEEVEYFNQYYKSDKAGFLLMREDYNNSFVTSLPVLYNLMCRSNSNMMRFNSSGGFNIPYGERNCCNIERIWEHHNNIQNVDLRNEDFGDLLDEYLEMKNLSEYTFYLDPPYFSTTATVQ